MDTLRIGIIGAGAIVRQRHLPGLRKLPNVEIVAVANSSLTSAQAFCDDLACEAKPYEKWEDVVQLSEIDIIWVGTTPHLHKPVTLAALKAGKHVFCQARMSTTLLDAEEMLSAADDHPELVTMLCPPPHGLSGDACIRKVLSDQTLGVLQTVRLQSFNDAYLNPSLPAHWRQRRELSGNNILTLGIHAEVLQRWLGSFQVTAAQGKIATPMRGNYEVTIPDMLQVLAEFDNGAVATLEFSAIYAGQAVERLEIGGTEGVLVYDYLTDEIHLQRHGAREWEKLSMPPELMQVWTVEADFINAVRNPSSPRPHPTFEDGVAYMKIVEEVANLL